MLLANIISLVLVLLMFIPLVFLVNSALAGLDFTTSYATSQDIIKLLKQRNLYSGNFYDLGSCRGGLSLKIAAAFPNMRITGVDNNRFRTVAAKIRGMFSINSIFSKEDLFESDLSSADIVYVYLPIELMPDLKIKLKAQLKPNSLVICNKVKFPAWETEQEIEQLFIYKI